jgi:hypothetical protein
MPLCENRIHRIRFRKGLLTVASSISFNKVMSEEANKVNRINKNIPLFCLSTYNKVN